MCGKFLRFSAPHEISRYAHKKRAVFFLNFVLHNCSAGPTVQDHSITPAMPYFISNGKLEDLTIIGLAEYLLPSQKCLFKRPHAKNLQNRTIFRIGEVRHLPGHEAVRTHGKGSKFATVEGLAVGQLPFSLNNGDVLVFRMEMGWNNHPGQLTDVDDINTAGFVRIARNYFTINPHWPKIHDKGVCLAPVTIAFTA